MDDLEGRRIDADQSVHGLKFVEERDNSATSQAPKTLPG
jgi:hypothetical protein